MKTGISATALVAMALMIAVAGAPQPAMAGEPVRAEDDLTRGEAVFEGWCAPCHGASRHAPGTLALTFKYSESLPPLLAARKDLDRDMIVFFVRNGVSVMPSFRRTEISDTDLDALARYIAASAARQGEGR